jgi:hypothetical protein
LDFRTWSFETWNFGTLKFQNREDFRNKAPDKLIALESTRLLTPGSMPQNGAALWIGVDKKAISN